MIGSIRKHSKWLWLVIASLTIVSFVYFMGQGPMKNGGGSSGGNANFGTVYGQPVTAQDYEAARGSFFIFYWLRTGQWPDKAGFAGDDLEREIYIRILVMKKAAQLDVQINEATLATAAGNFLQQFSRGNQPMPVARFVQQYLYPQKLGVGDLQNFLRYELTTRQLMQTLGLPGALVTPQEAGLIYDRTHQDFSTEAVVFAASNYVSQVAMTPAALGQFYSNNMAAYRVPERVQVSYVEFPLSNYLAAAEQKIGKTNLDAQVEANYRRVGLEGVPGATNAAQAKDKIRESLLMQGAIVAVREAANDFATTLFAMTPANPDNLAVVAKQKGVAVHTTAPFRQDTGPTEFMAPPDFVRAAFQLTAEEPFGGPLAGQDGIYILAMGPRLPSYIPGLSDIQALVTQDFQEQQSVMLAQRAGADFQKTVAMQVAAGTSFDRAAVAAGHAPAAVPPFSYSTQDLPEFGGRALLDGLKRAADATPAGHVSSFVPGQEGGFVLFVKGVLPVDQAKKKEELPRFTAQYQAERQNEAFRLWQFSEANRELLNIPALKKQMASQP